MRMDSLQYVREQLAAPGINLPAVARSAGVKERWLRMLAAGEIPEPGYGKVKALEDYFRSVDGAKPPAGRGGNGIQRSAQP